MTHGDVDWSELTVGADPRNRAILRYLTLADRPVDVAELTTHLGCNHNTVRQHLAVLRDAHVGVEETAPVSGRGRPKLLYRPAASLHHGWDSVDPYERLAGLLAEVVHTKSTPRDAGRAAGRRVAAGYGAGGRDGDSATGGVDAIAALRDETARLGFEPVERRRGRFVDLVLQRCPFESVAAADPATVCQLHLGLAEGLVESLGGAEVLGITVKDPHRAGCRLKLVESPPGRSR